MDLHPDFRDLLAEFARSGVEYVLIGGYAVGFHAKPRATKDLDLLVSGTSGNLERLAKALDEFGAPPHLSLAAKSLGVAEIIYFGVPPVRVDILRSADGIDTERAIARAERADLGGLSVPVIALDDLVANKRAAGRAQDLADVELLEKVRSGGR